MTISCVFLGDSNIRRFWSSGLADRRELSSKLEFMSVCNVKELETSLSKVSGNPKTVVMSVLTNIICDHVGSVVPQSSSNLNHSVRTVLVEVMTGLVYPFCEAHPRTKVKFICEVTQPLLMVSTLFLRWSCLI